MPPPKSDKIQFEIFILFIILDKFYDLIYIHRLDFVCALIADFPVFVDNRHRISDIGGAALEIEFFVYLGRARVIAGRNIPGLFVVGDPNLYSEIDKVELQPGETKTMTFELKADDLAFVGWNGKWSRSIRRR